MAPVIETRMLPAYAVRLPSTTHYDQLWSCMMSTYDNHQTALLCCIVLPLNLSVFMTLTAGGVRRQRRLLHECAAQCRRSDAVHTLLLTEVPSQTSGLAAVALRPLPAEAHAVGVHHDGPVACLQVRCLIVEGRQVVRHHLHEARSACSLMSEANLRGTQAGKWYPSRGSTSAPAAARG